MNNNYILARWRDAITDPPVSGWIGLNTMANGARYYGACGYMPGDQWLDITTIPGVARAKVQAAVDEMSRARSAEKLLSEESTNAEDKIHHRACEISFNHAAIYVAKHTGVTPSEAQ